MPSLTTSAEIVIQALKGVPSSRPIKFTVTADYDIELIPAGPDVHIWADWNKTRSVTKPLNQKRTYNLKPAGMAMINKDGALMTPVYWGKDDAIGWIVNTDFNPAVRLGIVNDCFIGSWVGNGSTWPCEPAPRQLKVWETVQIFQESATHFCIGQDEWILKEHVYLKPW